MTKNETYLGSVQDKRTTVSVSLSDESLTGFVYIDGQAIGGQIGSFVRIPIGFIIDLFGVISQVGAAAVPESQIASQATW